MRHSKSLICVAAIFTPVVSGAADRLYWAHVDNHERPPESYYNTCGGDRGTVGNLAEVAFSWQSGTAYRLEVNSVANGAAWTSGGFYKSIGHAATDKRMIDPAAAWDPLIKTAFQPRVQRVRVKVARAVSPTGRTDLQLGIELKGFDAGGAEVLRQAFTVDRAALIGGVFPKTFTFDIPAALPPIGMVNVLLDRAVSGDSVDIDDVDLEMALPDATPARRATLLSLGMLLGNWNSTTGMVDDRSNFPTGVSENVTATAKLAKLLAMGIQQGIVDPVTGPAAIDKIAATLLNVVPRGPSAGNSLWPHFTQYGGTQREPDSEWASGDTAYAANDLAVALRMIGDPQGRLPGLMAFIKGINWTALFDGSHYRHGYDKNGVLLPSVWQGAGAETLGVNFTAFASGRPMASMQSLPTDNGSGFILHAAYPVPFVGVDRYGVSWRQGRLAEIATQIGWYRDSAHANPFLAAMDLFGLSAAEPPGGSGYKAYGTGGISLPAEDENHTVVAPHYSGMIAALAPVQATAMFQRLEADGLLTPLTNVESMAVDPVTGAQTVNWLKGSWNLALFCEGWMSADRTTTRAAYDALQSIPDFSRAFNAFFPRTTSGETVVVTDGQQLIAIDPAQVQAEQVLSSGAPFTEPVRLSVTQTRIFFDAKGATGNNQFGRIYSLAFADLDLGIWRQHTSDPFGSSYDISPSGQFRLNGVAFLTNRTGSQRRVFETTGTFGSGTGIDTGAPTGGSAFSKVPGEDHILYACSSSLSTTLEKRDVRTNTLLENIPFSQSGGSLTVVRIDTAPDGRLLLSTGTLGIWLKDLSSGSLTQIHATGKEAAFNVTGKRIAFIVGGDLAVADLSTGGTLSNLTVLTATPARTEQFPVWVSRLGDSDYDSDGLSDVNETAAGSDWSNPDTDGDGQTDGAESLTGTDLLNPASRFAMTATASGNGQINLTWPSIAGRRYVIEKSADLAAGIWLPITGEIVATGASISFPFQPAPGENAGFFRVRIAQ